MSPTAIYDIAGRLLVDTVPNGKEHIVMLFRWEIDIERV